MTLRTVWSRKPAFAIEDPSAVPANGLAAQVATHPEWAGGGEALPAAGGIAAAPASSVAPPITAARRQAARVIGMTAFNSLTSFLVPLTEAGCRLTSVNPRSHSAMVWLLCSSARQRGI